MNQQEKPHSAAPAESGGLAGSKLTTVFAIVLAAHVVIIIAALSWYLLSGRSGDTALDQASAPATSQGGSSAGEARLETDPTPLISSEVLDTMNAVVVPGAGEPPWAAAPAPLPDADPFGEPEPGMGQTVSPLPPLAPLTPARAPVPAPVAVPAETAAALSRSGPPAQAAPRQAAQPQRSTATVQATTYRVVQGDTLTRIARRHGTTVEEIKRLNHLKTDALSVGQVLKVSGPAPAQRATAGRAGSGKEWTGSHTVAAGETLYRISRAYQVTPAELAKVNNITDPTRVRVGTVLRVPAGGTASAPQSVKPPPSREARAVPAPASGAAIETAPSVPASSRPVPSAAIPVSTSPVREAKAAPELKPFRPPVLTQEMMMMNM